MPIETFDRTKDKLANKEAYIEKYPMSDDGMYASYKALKKPEPWQKALIAWYESGFKPKGRPNMARFRHVMFELQRIGFPFESFASLLEDRFTDMFKVALWRNTKIMGENAALYNYELLMQGLPKHILDQIEEYDEETYTLR